MITMDVKGINWVGCVYEKFESMCLEVEENMYQDTVKFVEDQVQTVGESVKKFYADIMQDLLCDSSLDGDNISACGFPIEHYSDVDNSKKSKIRKTKEHVRVGVEEVNGDSEVISVVEKDVEHTGLFHRQRVYDSCTRSSGDCAKVACSDLYSRQDHGMRSYINKNLVVKQTPIKDRLPGANTAVGKDFNRVSLSCSEFSDENHDASCDQPDEVITPTLEGMRCDSMRERCVVANASQCTDDVSINCQSSDLIVLDKSDGKRWNELLESSIGGLSAESNGGSNNSSVHGTEISQQSDKAKLEETCVMVSGEELHFVHHMVANCKPYKMLDFEMETWSLPNWLKLENIIFESDSQELVAALNNRIEKGNWRIYPFLSEFHRLKGLLSSVSWSWISREANRAADVAAKLAK